MSTNVKKHWREISNNPRPRGVGEVECDGEKQGGKIEWTSGLQPGVKRQAKYAADKVGGMG